MLRYRFSRIQELCKEIALIPNSILNIHLVDRVEQKLGKSAKPIFHFEAIIKGSVGITYGLKISIREKSQLFLSIIRTHRKGSSVESSVESRFGASFP